ncbi:MAG TPA: LytTR family DNA-binding domain-containing protein [Flavisolibacter sp.]|jgi:DNA-binding LytR/AlgR family response regulator
MKKIHCIIVDDEPLARDLMAMYVNKLASWEIKAACRDVAEAYEALYQNEIDVIFLDINMPNKTGIDFLSTLKNPPHIIFTTAYAEYAAKAFDLKAIDYLVKPITEERFREAIEKAEAIMRGPEVPVAVSPQSDHVFLKQDSRLVKVIFDDILYVEALKDYSKIFMKEKTMLVSAHLKMMEEMLPQTRFFRIHRSYIVAMDKINAVQGNVVEIGKQEVPVSSTYKEELMKRLKIS